MSQSGAASSASAEWLGDDMNPLLMAGTASTAMWHQRFDLEPFEGATAASLASSEPLRLLHNEEESDVEFVVGPEGDAWCIAGHRDMLSASSPVFKAMLTGPLAHEGKVRIEDVDGRAFYQLLRVLYGAEPDKIRSERACLLTMYAANKYLCSKLFLHCVAAADAFLAPANVLRVMQAVRMFVPDNMEVETVFSPSAPPFEDSSDGESIATTVDVATDAVGMDIASPKESTKGAADVSAAPSTPLLDADKSWSKEAPPRRLSPARSPRRKPVVELGPAPVNVGQFPDPNVEANMGWYSAALYWNCLQLVDAYADDVLESDCIEELPHQDLLMLLRRESLHVRREARVYNALERWANRDCRRRGLYGSPENRRAALGEALFVVRYLRMSVRELLEAVKGGLLDHFETAWLLGMAVGDPHRAHPDNIDAYHPPETLRPYARFLAVLRPAPRPCFIQLSSRCVLDAVPTASEATMTDWSWPMDMTEAEVKRQVKALKQIAKMQRKEEKRQRRLEQERAGRRTKCTSGCFAEAFFSILAFIFD